MTTRQARPEEAGLRSDNHETLNARFYESAPWPYFEHRLFHLALAASDPKRYREALREPISVGQLALQIEFRDAHGAAAPSREQTFAAIDAEVLLHHAAETLLRLVHAHADADPCPWLRMARVRSAGEFKRWVEEHLADVDARERLCRSVFSHGDDPGVISTIAEYVELLARYFLKPGSYNAGKHGMALDGASERLNVTIDEIEILNRDGASLAWLDTWPPPGDPERPPRWALMWRQFSLEAVIAIIWVTTLLMRSIWERARHEHLGEPAKGWPQLRKAAEIFEAFDLRHWVIAETMEPLQYDGVEPTLIIQTRHPRIAQESPSEDEAVS